MSKRVLLCTLMLCLCSLSPAQEEETPSAEKTPTIEELSPSVVSFGHLVTSNSEVLNKGDATIGTLIIAYGITDNWTTGISPLVILNFNMLNFHNRTAWDLNEDVVLGVEHTYFKTYNAGYNTNLDNHSEDFIRRNPSLWQSYEMEAHALKTTATIHWFNTYRTSFTFSYYKYINDERPFSLRMDPQNSDDYAVSLTSLHEFFFHEKLRFNSEFGFWGMNYTYPYLHAGLSLQFIAKNFLLGMGMSATYSPFLPEERVRSWGPGYKNRVSYHPEVQVQFFL